ncbi:THO complex subunit 1, partial [Varanus komodoensis]
TKRRKGLEVSFSRLFQLARRGTPSRSPGRARRTRRARAQPRTPPRSSASLQPRGAAGSSEAASRRRGRSRGGRNPRRARRGGVINTRRLSLDESVGATMSPPPLFSLPEARLRFTNSTRDALKNKTIKPLLSAFSQIPGSENEKKLTLDQAFRVALEEEIINKACCENVLSIISLVINGVTEGEAVAVLNRCLAEVREWMRANKLKLNPDKTEVLLVGRSGFGEGGFDLVLNGATLPLRDKVRSLGVLLDPELSLEAQVTAVARNAFLQLRLINQLRPYLEYDCLATVTHALVTSRLDFCNALYVGLPLKTVRTLQLVQNRAARLLTGTGRYAHMTPVLRQLHWLPIEARAQFKVLIMTYKALNGLGPGYLNERLRICTASTPFVLLGDVLDCLPLDQCDKIFTFVEKNVTTWKSNTFYSAGKNYLLRMCNDLLRRLSKSQNTVFCGRIQLFLARLFPLSEKSGLNLQSQFNLENITVFNTSEQESTLGQKHVEERDEGMEVEEGEMGDDEAPTSSSIPIDYNLYRKFWSLQDYFRNPVQCYEKVSWKTFLKYSEEVLTVFKSYKLDDTQASRKKLEELKTGEEHVYFAKFLTSEKLMDLQLSDSNFRRHILLQYLILFQYLKGQVKFKSSNYILTDEQSLWIEDTTKLVYQLLSENPPDGERFSKMVEHILNTEENWNSWKNEGCPSFVKERPSDSKPIRPFVRKRPAPEDFLGKGPNKKILMGNEELTRLWNLCPDNMEACKSESREYMPTLEEFFEEAIEQADPENMVDKEFKVVNNSNYGWRALRLLARRSPHFFQPTNQQFKSLPEYLENMVIKLAKELPPPSEEIKTGEDEDEEDNDALLKENNESPDVQRDKLVTGEQIELFANKLGEYWKVLAPYLEMKDSDIRQIESDSEDVKMRAKQLLVTWQDQEGIHATMENLITALNKAGLNDLAEGLTNDTENNT